LKGAHLVKNPMFNDCLLFFQDLHHRVEGFIRKGDFKEIFQYLKNSGTVVEGIPGSTSVSIDKPWDPKPGAAKITDNHNKDIAQPSG